MVVSVLLQLVEKMRMPQLKKHGAWWCMGRRGGHVVVPALCVARGEGVRGTPSGSHAAAE